MLCHDYAVESIELPSGTLLRSEVGRGVWSFRPRAHFAESHIRRTVGENLQCLLRHRRRGDACVDNAASLIMHNYASDAIPLVQQPLAEATLALMHHLAKSNIHANFLPCIHTLEKVLRSLSKPRRQKLVSLLVELPMDPHVSIKDQLV